MMKSREQKPNTAKAAYMEAKLVAKKIEDAKNSDDTWSFPVQHPAAMCLEELGANLTRDRPLMYTMADGKGNHDAALFVFIHCSLLHKSGLIGITAPKIIKRISLGNGVVQLSKAADISDWIAWGKAVKNARWKGSTINIKVNSPVL